MFFINDVSQPNETVNDTFSSLFFSSILFICNKPNIMENLLFILAPVAFRHGATANDLPSYAITQK